MYKDLVEYIVRSIVDHPDEVSVTETQDDAAITVELAVADEDMGRVIGKQGRVINSIRSIVQVQAAKHGARVNLEINED
jgi:predicted RNA-binding protein YlqC (UPF0109 family)